MRIVLLLSFFILTRTIHGQDYPFWDDLTPGEYNVGYLQTVEFNERQHYEFEGYRGSKPYFIGVWFPTTQDEQEKATYQAYFDYQAPDELDPLADSLAAINQTSLINYGLKKRMNSSEDRMYDEPHQNLLQQILTTKINASKATLSADKKFPVIVYHHGMGGTFEENAVLFEFLASHGFIIVSSNFHWPNQNRDLNDLVDDLRFVLDYATNLGSIDKERIHIMGHSWGTQIGLVFNQQGDDRIKSFIYLDSTLEPLPLRIIQRYYPELDSVFTNYPGDFKTQSYLITSPKAYLEEGKLEEQPPPLFEVFKKINTSNMSFLTSTEIMDHESFTSTALLRRTFLGSYVADDSTALLSQKEAYLKLCQDLLELLNDAPISALDFLKKVELE